MDRSDIVAFLFGALLIACLAFYTVQRDYRSALDLWGAQLSAAVRYRAWTLRTSLDQSRDDASLLAGFSPTRASLRSSISEDTATNRALGPVSSQTQVSDLFGGFKQIYGYAAIYLFDREGHVVVQATDPPLWTPIIQSQRFKEIFGTVNRTHKFSADLISVSKDQLVLAFVAPVLAKDSKSPLGVVAILDPVERELLFFITAHSTPVATSSETVLIQLINPGGHYVRPSGKGTLPEKPPSSRDDTLLNAASAVGATNVVFGEFIDSRGISILAAMEKIPAINSVVVCKVNTEEALASLTRVVRVETIAAGGFILAWAGVILLHRRSATAREMRTVLAQQQFANETLESTVTERTSQLARINERLHSELLRRETAEKEIRELNAQLERRVQERTGELESANKELATFAYSVSHDLRAPLRGIDGWSLALLEDYANQLDSTGQQYLARVRSETQRMGNLIDDMLLLSRLARDEMTLSSVDLSALARGIAENLRDSVPERSIEFAIAPGLAVPGDQRLLEIALTNLLSNAVKFTAKRDKARIEFGESRKNGEAAFYVRDNGAGFDMNYASHLFGAFQRLHKESEFPGNGIGLATVQRVVSRHGGRVWAEAQIDAGATFWFTVRCPSK